MFRLDATESGLESISLTATSTTQGTYYFGACLDADGSDEADTTNNCSGAVAVTVGAAPAPDLVVDGPTVSESAPEGGSSFHPERHGAQPRERPKSSFGPPPCVTTSPPTRPSPPWRHGSWLLGLGVPSGRIGKRALNRSA